MKTRRPPVRNSAAAADHAALAWLRDPVVRRNTVGALVALALVAISAAIPLAVRAAEALSSGGDRPAEPPRKVDFAREVQPILARRCFACHGPDKGEGGLRLNSREGATAELDSGEHAVVPEKPSESELLRRITSEDEAERMPPKDKPLTAEQVALLRDWIASGADWSGNWAFERPRPTQPPAVHNDGWIRNDVDRFIVQRLEAKGLEPAPPAEKTALLRRAYFDLIGLPPAPADVDAFLADNSPDAFAKVVDRLLDSPQYGEQWARHWLDVVRYADTNSFERDGVKPHAWRYRDYVIRALNADKPYNQFLREQLAGDELAPPTSDAIIATGFYRLGLWDDEPADREQARYEELDDIVTTTSQALLGLTLNCARCHDHKIDPLTQRDYYQMLAFFQGVRGMTNDGPNVETQIFDAQVDESKFTAEVRELERQFNDAQVASNQLSEKLLKLYRESAPPNAPVEIYPPDLEDLEYRFYRDTFEKLPNFDELKPESTGKLPGYLIDLSPATRDTAFGLVFQGYLIVPREGDYEFFLDSDDGARLTLGGNVLIDYDGVHVMGNARKLRLHLLPGRTPFRLDYFQKDAERGLNLYWGGPFGHHALFKTNNPRERRPVDLDAFIASDGARLLGAEESQKFQDLRKRLAEMKNRKTPAQFALSVSENGAHAADTFILGRGSVHSPGEKVEPAFPGILASGRPAIAKPADNAKSTGRRTALADWLASAENPLTARVMANRIWQHHFGRGIVRSPNNFGGLGIPPTHPELLDWLAQKFVEGGWQVKSLHRLIMLSSTYQMSSRASAAALEKDPTNDLFSRFDMRRLTAEEVRDSILAVDGRLNNRMFGPGIFPELSAEVLASQSIPGNGWGKSSAAEQARRSVYIHVKRSLIVPMLSNFDFPDPDTSCEARFATTQPTQALGMLNGKFLQDEAAALASRLDSQVGSDPTARVTLTIRLCFARPPTATEVDRSLKLIAALKTRFGLDDNAAWKLYCLTVLNQNEFLYLD